ncbi:MAG: hypothetical protein IJ252_06935 [Solobacterium sp.]|nr:hypothetical protein [Solobacterium sp.]
MKETILKKLTKEYVIDSRDMGKLRTIRKGLFHFECEAYTIRNTGNLFFIGMSAMFGLMKMETAVITPLEKDLSFCNLDTVKAAGKETYMFEMYRSALHEDDLSAFAGMKKKYSSLPDYEFKPRWYDSLRLDSSIAKSGKKISASAEIMMNDCLDTYLALLRDAPVCDREEKKKAVGEYVDRLIHEGGEAVDSMNKIIGPELTAKLIREFMYGL